MVELSPLNPKLHGPVPAPGSRLAMKEKKPGVACLYQNSRVNALLKLKAGLLGTRTYCPLPFKLNPWPTLPAAKVAPFMRTPWLVLMPSRASSCPCHQLTNPGGAEVQTWPIVGNVKPAAHRDSAKNGAIPEAGVRTIFMVFLSCQFRFGAVGACLPPDSLDEFIPPRRCVKTESVLCARKTSARLVVAVVQRGRGVTHFGAFRADAVWLRAAVYGTTHLRQPLCGTSP